MFLFNKILVLKNQKFMAKKTWTKNVYDPFMYF